MRVHNAIFVVYLERAIDPVVNLYLDCHGSPPPAVGEREYEIEELVRK